VPIPPAPPVMIAVCLADIPRLSFKRNTEHNCVALSLQRLGTGQDHTRIVLAGTTDTKNEPISASIKTGA